MDNTLDQYIYDLREANKQADMRKLQMETHSFADAPLRTLSQDNNQASALDQPKEA